MPGCRLRQRPHHHVVGQQDLRGGRDPPQGFQPVVRVPQRHGLLPQAQEGLLFNQGVSCNGDAKSVFLYLQRFIILEFTFSLSKKKILTHQDLIAST